MPYHPDGHNFLIISGEWGSSTVWQGGSLERQGKFMARLLYSRQPKLGSSSRMK